LTFDPSSAFQAKSSEESTPNGKEPILGGRLRAKAVWVDESKCIGCTYCSSVATNTFAMDSEGGRARAFRQDGDSNDLIQEAIDTCPVDCIQWVNFEELEALRERLEKEEFRPLGLPPWT
tara:strand:- start:14984 stop:15343 length:360 start_codon:yes stop_codon:yes gene_type:complete